jgi:hypothetical protein
MNWISVKTRLPEDSVAVFVTDGIMVDVSFSQLTYCGDDPNERTWFNRITPNSFGKITHWMPLPEPPNEK